MKYYIISLHHTSSIDSHICLWRPDDSGYCYTKFEAGVYHKITKGYHTSERNLPISVDDAKLLFQTTTIDGHVVEAIPNNMETWAKLGVKISKNKLVRV